MTASRETLAINKIFINNFCVGIMRYLNRILLIIGNPILILTIFINWDSTLQKSHCLSLSRTIYIIERTPCQTVNSPVSFTESILCLHVTNPLTLWRLVIHKRTERFSNRSSAFFLYKLLMCFERISEQRAVASAYSINGLHFIFARESVNCAVFNVPLYVLAICWSLNC